MKLRHITLSAIAMLFALTSSCQNRHPFKSVGLEEFKETIADTANIILVDVRTADEHAQGHIPGTKCNIDALKGDFESIAVSTLPKEKTIAIYCRSGRRSKSAASTLSKNGFKVVELNTGFNSWK